MKHIEKKLVEIRRDIHRHPELAFAETRTAGLVAERMTKLGLEVRTGVAKTGVVAVLNGAESGRTVLVRADMDALPITEKNDVEYASCVPGVMHACGHDGHTAIMIGVAETLSRHREDWRGSIKFVFQPSEEVPPGGAAKMIEEGVLDDPKVDAAIGLHLWNDLPLGKVGVRPGLLTASADRFEITVKGTAAHGAMPQRAVDSIVVSAQVISSLQTILSREIAPLKIAVVSLGTITGGTAFNIIADKVRMSGTVRTLDSELRQTMPERMERIIRGVTAAMRAEYEFNYEHCFPSIVNDEAMAQLVREAACSVVGTENVLFAEQTMLSEDMSFFLQKVPGCYFFLGSANKAKGLDKPNHTPYFDFDEGALTIGVEIVVRAVLRYLSASFKLQK